MSIFAIKILLKERRVLLDDMQLRGPGKGLFDSRPFLVGELDNSIKTLKKANGKKK